MWFDIHWHARDEEQRAKETIARSLALAEAGGSTAIAAMPNTARPLTTLERCRDYLSIADKVRSPVQFYVYIGLTSDVEQIKRAVEACRMESRIIGMKMYCGKSTGDLTIDSEEEQHQVLEILANENYQGVLMTHCEKESRMHDEWYNPNNPLTWSTRCRPEEAEIESVKDILRITEEVHFPGKIHIAHVSTVEVVDLIHSYQGPLQLSCGITPHHLFLNYNKLEGPDGVWFKCNPPLRSPETQEKLLERLLQGKIPIIESDHAPHIINDKMKSLPASGIHSGVMWPYVIHNLGALGMPSQQIFEVTFSNAVKLYNLNLQPREAAVGWQRMKQFRAEYPFDPFKFTL